MVLASSMNKRDSKDKSSHHTPCFSCNVMGKNSLFLTSSVYLKHCEYDGGFELPRVSTDLPVPFEFQDAKTP